MRLLLITLLLVTFVASSTLIERNLRRELQTTSSCPNVTFTESYQTTYQVTFSIFPTHKLNCPGKNYTIINGTVQGTDAFGFNQARQELYIKNWAALQDDTFYNLTYVATLSDGTKISNWFYFIVGTSSISFTPIGNLRQSYDTSFSVDYAQAFDPIYPKTGTLLFNWVCPSTFNGCQSLGKTSTFNALTRIKTNKMAFDYTYTFNVQLTNALNQRRTANDAFTINLTPPQVTSEPLSCINFTLKFKSITPTTITTNKVSIVIDSENYQDLIMTQPLINTDKCAQQFTTYQTYAFTSFSNVALFDDIRSYEFNGTDIVINKNRLYQAFRVNKVQEFTSYVYLIDSFTQKILGFQYVTVEVSLNDRSIYAVVTQPSIQVDSNKILYIDASPSYDAKLPASTSYNYIWGIEGQSSLKFANTKLLVIYPSNRTKWGINSQGKEYIFTLKINDTVTGRQSQTLSIPVLITPVQDSSNCVKVDSTFPGDFVYVEPIWPLTLSAVITNKKCKNTILGDLVWEAVNLPNLKFWTLQENNQVFVVNSNSLDQLPKSKNITMAITQYYKIGSIAYASRYTFKLQVKREYLVPVVEYPSVVNMKNVSVLELDASGSYGTYDVARGTFIEQTCHWTCPQSLSYLCDSASYIYNRCNIQISSTEILKHPNYTQILNQAQPFTVSITKGDLYNSTTVFVLFTEVKNGGTCIIEILVDFSINHYALFQIKCPTTTQTPTYQWSLASDNYDVTDVLNGAVSLNQEYLHVPPYTVHLFQQVRITCIVKVGTSVFKYGVNKYVNSQDTFIKGQLNVNYNQITAYLSNFVLTPVNMGSRISKDVYYQFRLKERSSPFPIYRVLLSETTSDQLNPISLFMPQITHEQAVYFDVIDEEGNYLTVRQPLMSTTDVQMNFATFNIRLTNVFQSVSMIFNENEFELNVFKIRQLFHAYANDLMNIQGVAQASFQDLAQQTIEYLNSQVVINTRLNDISEGDRAIVIRHHIVEIISYITRKHKQLSNQDDMLALLQLVLSQPFALNNMVLDASLSVVRTVQQLSEVKYQSVYDQLLALVYVQVKDILQAGEFFYYSKDGYEISVYELTNFSNDIPSLNYFSFNKQTIQTKGGSEGLLFIIRNSTFLHVQLLNKSLKTISITGLTPPVNITLQLSTDQLALYQAKSLNISCASKESLSGTYSNSTSKIKLVSVDKNTGKVICQATHFSLYTLQMQSVIPPINNNGTNTTNGTNGGNQTTNNTNGGNQTNNNTNGGNSTNNNTNGGEQNVNGTWNDSLGNQTGLNYTTYKEQDKLLIFEEKADLMTGLSLMVLGIFILSNIAICLLYKNESQTQSTNNQSKKHEYQPQKSLFVNRMILFKQVMIQFNPYLNLFLVYNKFLSRWIRNTLTQIYFMTISFIFGMNQALLTLELSQLGYSDSLQLIGMFFIGLCIVVMVRPWSILFFYKLLYEPNNKVQDLGFQSESNRVMIKVDDTLKIHCIKDLKENSIDDVQTMRNSNSSMKKKSEEIEDVVEQSGPLKSHSSNGIIETNFNQNQIESKFNVSRVASKNTLKNEEMKVNDYDQELIDGAQFKFTSIHLGHSNSLNKNRYKNSNKKPPTIPSQKKDSQHSKFSSSSNDQTFHLANPQCEDMKETFGNKNDQLHIPKYEMDTIDPLSQRDPIPKGLNLPKIKIAGSMQTSQVTAAGNDKLPTLNRKIEGTDSQTQFQSNQFEDFNLLVSGFEEGVKDGIEYEGGSDEECQERKLGRDNEEELALGLNMINGGQNESFRVESPNFKVIPELMLSPDFGSQATIHQINQGYETPNVHRQLIEIKPTSAITKKDSYSSTQLGNESFQEEDNLMNEHRTFFVNKHIGKLLLLLFWIGLVVANIYCLKSMSEENFINWVILSCATFLIIQLVIDPVLYWILVLFMIPTKSKLLYHSKKFNRRSCTDYFIVLFIGKAKMRDLRRRLNPYTINGRIENNNGGMSERNLGNDSSDKSLGMKEHTE